MTLDEALAQLDAANALLREALEESQSSERFAEMELRWAETGDIVKWQEESHRARTLSAKISTYLKDGR